MKMENEWLAEPDFAEESFVEYDFRQCSYKLWYGRAGKGNRPPALVLHGGPGGNHHNLVAFQSLGDRRPVIFYDQLGCGKSDRPNTPALWFAERFYDEVASVRDALRLEQYHLIGHSWGTTLAVGFASRHPEGILSVSLNSPVLSFPEYLERISPMLKESLGGDAAKIIDDYELRGIGDARSYEEACLKFLKRYVTLTWPMPGAMQRLIAARNQQIHDVMVASDSELNIPGNLRSVDVTGQLARLKIPVLMTCGENDVCTPEYTRWQSGFARAVRVSVIPESAHMTAIDNPAELIKVHRQFLEDVEKRI